MSRPTDADHLKTFEERIDLLRDRVRGVVSRYYTGAFFTGRPGTGKTFSVIETLESLGCDYVVKNGHVTAAGLYECFEQNPDSTIVIDDVNRLYSNEIAKAILLAATSTEPVRRITYTTKDKNLVTIFTGGVMASAYVKIADVKCRACGAVEMLVEHDVLHGFF